MQIKSPGGVFKLSMRMSSRFKSDNGPVQTQEPGTNLPALLPGGALARLETNAKSLLLRHMRPVYLATGQRAFRAGDSATNYVFVKTGSLRVGVTSEEGRDIVLYRVQPGETCVLTTSALMSGQPYEAEAQAETETEAIVLPKVIFEELMTISPGFRQHVFASFGERLHTLLALVQEVTVRHLDRRLARLLLHLQTNGLVKATHHELAQELHSVREVVTRLLHDFAERDWIALSRGRIELKDVSALGHLAQTV
jgi:CRP/FNR family transcriptional regulator, anaerobic regulatory protein